MNWARRAWAWLKAHQPGPSFVAPPPQLFGLAERGEPAQMATPKEAKVDHKASVAALLGGAAGAAEALLDCGIDQDDTELVSHFLNGMNECHAIFVAMTNAAGVPPDQQFDCIRTSMQFSPAMTNPWFLWRLASVLRTMANREVLEAAREAASAHEEWKASRGTHGALAAHSKLEHTMAKLAAVLPKEE